MEEGSKEKVDSADPAVGPTRAPGMPSPAEFLDSAVAELNIQKRFGFFRPLPPHLRWRPEPEEDE